MNECTSAIPAIPPPPGIFVSKDVDEVVEVLSRHLAPHRLYLRDARQSLRAEIRHVDLGGVELIELSYGTRAEADPGEIEGQYFVHTALAGASEMLLANDSHPIDLRKGTVTSPGERPRFRMSASCRHLTACIDRSTLESYFARSLGEPIVRPIRFDVEVAEFAPFARAWRGLVAHIRDQADAVPRMFSDARRRVHYTDLLLDLLLHELPHNYTSLLNRRASASVCAWHVQRACELVEEHIADGLTVAGLARAAGVSVRSLQMGFRQALGVSPLEYIRSRRLERLHASLLAAGTAASVTDIMLDHGVQNFGRFAQYYRQRFGRNPSDTLRRRSES
jgi:AraC-like DNA-binding protein